MNKQTTRVLELLRAARPHAVETGVFMDNYIASYSQRCGDLRKMGYVIERRRCPERSSWSYKLISEPNGEPLPLQS